MKKIDLFILTLLVLCLTACSMSKTNKITEGEYKWHEFNDPSKETVGLCVISDVEKDTAKATLLHARSNGIKHHIETVQRQKDGTYVAYGNWSGTHAKTHTYEYQSIKYVFTVIDNNILQLDMYDSETGELRDGEIKLFKDLNSNNNNSPSPQAINTQETTKTMQKYSNVIFSSTIGEVNEKTYCARKSSYGIDDNGLEQSGKIIAEAIPIETGEYGIIASFCYYDGYVYYVESEGGTSDYRTWLYRCKPDWSGKELLYSDDVNSPSYGEREFIIDNNILYYGSYDPDKEVETIDLSTMKTSKGNMPKYNFGDVIDMVVYNGKLFFIDENRNLYVEEDGNKRFLASDAYFDGGLAGDYLYYVEYNYEARLYKISLTSGEKELIDSRMPVGGGGPYFCW